MRVEHLLRTRSARCAFCHPLGGRAPAATAFTRTLCLANSTAIDRVKRRDGAFRRRVARPGSACRSARTWNWR